MQDSAAGSAQWFVCYSCGGPGCRDGAADGMTSLGPSRCERRPLLTPGREFLCGWGAAFINISITFPINKIMFRQVGAVSRLVLNLHSAASRVLL